MSGLCVVLAIAAFWLGCVDGLPQTHLAIQAADQASVVVDTHDPIFHTSERYMCWNIDSSSNREYFTIDWSDPKLRYLAKAIGPSVVRMGGSGNDQLTYQFGNTTCSSWKGCLNSTTWDNVVALAHEADADIVFALNLRQRTPSGEWDPTNSRELLEYSIAKGVTFFGLELGNEVDRIMKAGEQAKGLKALDDLLHDLYRDTTRPRLLGPDPNCFKDDPSYWPVLLSFMQDFMNTTHEYGVDLFAVTSHEYIEVNQTNFLDPSHMDNTRLIGEQKYALVQQFGHGAEVWAGEIGPHNGGSPPCSAISERWACFNDSFWYVDALGAKAATGYSVFCRQDLVGADYGLLDCATHDPNPDYYMAVMFNRLMGQAVWNTTSSTPTLRAYTHCHKSGGGNLAMALVNLATAEVEVDIDSLSHVQRVEYHFTTDDLTSQVAKLNGNTLTFDGTLPPLVGKPVSAGAPLTLSATSIAFVEFLGTGVAACGEPSKPL